MASAQFQMSQGDIKSLSNPTRITAVGGDNATEFYLYFPYFPPGAQWVFPFVYGFMYVVDSPSYTPVVIDASQFPPGAQAPPTSTKIARLVAYNTDQVFNPGISSTGATLTRWAINNSPALGAQATATKAAMPGVTHVADMFAIKIAQTGAVVSVISGIIRDGPSGTGAILFTELLSISATAGDKDQIDRGPGMNIRGTPGNAMTVETTSLIANVYQSAFLNGFDQ